ncbi:hypothetical protein D3C75_925760 [compost metagenome]
MIDNINVVIRLLKVGKPYAGGSKGMFICKAHKLKRLLLQIISVDQYIMGKMAFAVNFPFRDEKLVYVQITIHAVIETVPDKINNIPLNDAHCASLQAFDMQPWI